LLQQLEAAKGRTPTSISAAAISYLTDVAKDFNLGPDASIDITRLPTNVVDLESLIAFLRSVKDMLAKRDNKTKTEDWDVAKQGTLKQYKVFVCCIHTLLHYLGTNPVFDTTISQFAEAAVAVAPAAKPLTMSSGGQKMWDNTIGVNFPRSVMCMKLLVYFMTTYATQAPAPAPAGGN
jgi:hypothetical protein